jgi:hypothetical protein
LFEFLGFLATITFGFGKASLIAQGIIRTCHSTILSDFDNQFWDNISSSGTLYFLDNVEIVSHCFT